MDVTRRRFLELSAATGAAGMVGLGRPLVSAAGATGRAAAAPATKAGNRAAQDWLTRSNAYMIGSSEMTGLGTGGGQSYPPVFPFNVLGTASGQPSTTDVVISHAPLDPNFFAECHKLGMRCLVYMVPCCGPPSIAVTSSDPMLLKSIASGTYMGVGWSPVWWEKATDGTTTTMFNTAAGAPPQSVSDGMGVQLAPVKGTGGVSGVPVPCCNTQSCVDAMLAWIDVIMGMGADGVFLDVVQLRSSCYGDIANANNTTPHAHLYTPASSIPALNPSDPTDPFADWIALAVPNGSQTLAQAQDAAGRQGAQNWAFTRLLAQIRARVRTHRYDGAVVGNVGVPTYPTTWMRWFTGQLDACFIENFVMFDTGAGSAREPEYGLATIGGATSASYIAGFFNLNGNQRAPTQPPCTPPTYEVAPWPSLISDQLRPWVQSGNRLMTISRVSHLDLVPGNSPQTSVYDTVTREDAFLSFCMTQLALGVAWPGAVYYSLSNGQGEYFYDLHQLVLGSPVGHLVQLDASGTVLPQGSTPATTVGVFARGVVVVNWTAAASGGLLVNLQSIATASGKSTYVPDTVYDMFNGNVPIRRSAAGTTPLVPAYAPNPASAYPVTLAAQARIYTYRAQPAYGSQSIRRPQLQPPQAASNATAFGPSTPTLPGGPFLYTFARDDVYGATIGTGPGGTPFPWNG